MICAKSPDKVPDSKKIRAATVGLAALDIIFGDGRPVFYFERNWQKGVDAAFMDNREGGQWSIRFSDSGSLFKGTHSQAFMFPGGNPPFEKERKHGLATYPGVLVGFPEKLTFLLSDPDPFQEITFCLWADSKAAPWQVGAVCWPEEVDDPDASEELIAYLESPSEAFIELAKDVYGVVVKDKGAVESIFKKEPLTPELLRRLTNSVSLASIAIALGDISYPVSFEEVQSASKTGFAAKTSAQGAQATDDKTRDFYRDDHLLDPDSTIAETAMGAI
ncbi:MAG: hypothetical protein K8F91_20135, partial [Candidatus Obscuribacterales bacterium]|nr:hypothetical protein [Candidatus Obscuribacterales bacterium]